METIGSACPPHGKARQRNPPPSRPRALPDPCTRAKPIRPIAPAEHDKRWANQTSRSPPGHAVDSRRRTSRSKEHASCRPRTRSGRAGGAGASSSNDARGGQAPGARTPATPRKSARETPRDHRGRPLGGSDSSRLHGGFSAREHETCEEASGPNPPFAPSHGGQSWGRCPRRQNRGFLQLGCGPQVRNGVCVCGGEQMIDLGVKGERTLSSSTSRRRH